MYCKKCGALISENAHFCTKCGSAVQESKVQMTEENRQDVSEESSMEDGEGKKSKAVVLAAVFVICIAGALGALYISKRNEDSEATAEQAANEEMTEETEENAQPTPEPKTVETLLSEGKEYLSKNNFVEAVACFKDAKALDANQENVYIYGADVYLSQGNYQEALIVLEEGITALDSEVLKCRRDYILENIVIKEQKPEEGANVSYEYDEFGNLLKGNGREYAYNENGKVTEETVYDADGVFIEKYGYKYDADGKMLQMMSYAENGTALGWTQYEYADNGHIINEVYYDENGEISWWYGYAYEDGFLSKKIFHESDGDVAFWYEYDAAGNQLREIHNSDNGKVDWWNELVYDENGKVLSEVEYNYRGKVNWRGEYTYNENGDRIKSVTYNGDDTISDWREHVYDSAGRLLKSTNYEHDGSVYLRVEYAYDAEGNEIKYTSYNENGIATDWQESEYVTDENGNTVITVYNEKGETESSKTINQSGLVIAESNGTSAVSYEYTYIGDILSTGNVNAISGTLRVDESVALPCRRMPAKQAACVEKEVSECQVIGETDEFYQLENGWYVEKTHPGIVFTEQ